MSGELVVTRMKPLSELNDAELLRSMMDGNEEALGALYERRQGAVFRFAWQMSGSQTVAEDVTQEVFLFLIREARIFDPNRGSVSAFLMGVARNYVLRRLRGDHALVSLGDDSDDDFSSDRVDTDVSPLDDLTRAETIEHVRKAVLSLPEKYREVVVLCELHELNYKETAEILECAIGTVRSRLHRARAILLEKLRPANLENESASALKSARCFA